MSILGGRGGRSDDWESQHARARARAAQRLAGPLDPDEARWLDDHLGSCAECSAVADDYAAQRLELRALRNRQPAPPRDLWARTAAAIERESGGRSRERARGRRRPSVRRLLAPYAVLAGALVVAVVYGTLSSSQLPVGPVATTPGSSPVIALASDSPPAGPTPLAVAPQDVAYLSSEGGAYRLNRTRVDHVCPEDAGTCATSEPSEVVDIGPLASPATVYGSGDRSLVIVGDDAEGGDGSSVVVLTITDEPAPTPSPELATDDPSATASPAPTPTAAAGTPEPTADPGSTATPTATPPTPTPTPPFSFEPSPSSEPGSVVIARGLQVIDTTAAYAPDDSAFAFTARPADGSLGPDIYVWRVGETEAHAVTTDHRSVFGSWVGGAIVGSTIETTDGVSEPRAFVIGEQAAEPILRPEIGLVWRPVVDPTGGSAVYWSGTLEPADDGTRWVPGEGRLVIGRWPSTPTPDASASPSPSATPSPPSPPTLTGDQDVERAETTIAEGPLTDWDVRWDETGERLAVWIADPDDPMVGRLSLYVVDPFDGRIDLTNPPLVDEPALAGFSIADGRLAWASPAGRSGRSSKVLILAWTPEDFGQVESAPGDFILVR